MHNSILKRRKCNFDRKISCLQNGWTRSNEATREKLPCLANFAPPLYLVSVSENLGRRRLGLHRVTIDAVTAIGCVERPPRDKARQPRENRSTTDFYVTVSRSMAYYWEIVGRSQPLALHTYGFPYVTSPLARWISCDSGNVSARKSAKCFPFPWIGKPFENWTETLTTRDIKERVVYK